MQSTLKVTDMIRNIYIILNTRIIIVSIDYYVRIPEALTSGIKSEQILIKPVIKS